ncbi:hypothetical protein [Bdellovibrio sp. HCB-162]|uniref:hypothetical protein n=1 Tax=Bdellovibrio sp. HCB-162 TaxID=3394234 RepID=UPI0039BCB409
MKFARLCILVSLSLTACIGSDSQISSLKEIVSMPIAESPIVSPISPSSPVVTAPTSDEFTKPEAAVAKVESVVKALNEDQNYALVSEDMSLLESEGLLSEENELKGWVK